MNIFEFAEKKGYYENGLLSKNKTVQQINRELNKNKIDQKRYFILKDKKRKGIELNRQEELFLLLKSKDIIW